MARTNVDIDIAACAEVMRRYHLSTKREAINFALRALAAEPPGVEVPHSRRLRLCLWPGPARRPWINRPRSLTLPGDVCSMEEARRLRASGWEGDLETLRSSRVT